jgi:hypothetical protein
MLGDQMGKQLYVRKGMSSEKMILKTLRNERNLSYVRRSTRELGTALGSA